MKTKWCINCRKKEVSKSINLDNCLQSYEIFCEECKTKQKECEGPTCLNCNKKLKKSKDLYGEETYIEGPYCYGCRDKKIEKARRKGFCIMCFKEPQLNVLNRGGTKTEFCEKCATMFTLMLERIDENKKLNEPLWEQKRIKDSIKLKRCKDNATK
jgi:hypothetical protein